MLCRLYRYSAVIKLDNFTRVPLTNEGEVAKWSKIYFQLKLRLGYGILMFFTLSYKVE